MGCKRHKDVRASPPAYANGVDRVVWPASEATGDPVTAKTPPLPLPCSVAFFPLNENTPGIYLAWHGLVPNMSGRTWFCCKNRVSRSDLGGGLVGTRDRAPDLAPAQPPLVSPLVPTGGDALRNWTQAIICTLLVKVQEVCAHIFKAHMIIHSKMFYTSSLCFIWLTSTSTNGILVSVQVN